MAFLLLSFQWRERSYTEEDSGDTVRIYTACNVDLDNVDNWLRTPYIARGNANRLYIEMRFTMRTCQMFPDPENLHQCRESFKLYYYEAESDFANSMMPTWDTETYSHVDVVAADQTFRVHRWRRDECWSAQCAHHPARRLLCLSWRGRLHGSAVHQDILHYVRGGDRQPGHIPQHDVWTGDDIPSSRKKVDAFPTLR